MDVALNGWPRPKRVTEDEQRLASQMWAQGAAAPEVRLALGWSARRWRDRLADGSLVLPRRVTQADLGRRFGWSPTLAKQLRAKGVIPGPDSPEGPSTWWWETTVTNRIEPRLAHSCGACGARFTASKGLHIHAATRH